MKRCLKEKKNEWQLNEASQGSAKQLTIKCLSLYYLLHVGVLSCYASNNKPGIVLCTWILLRKGCVLNINSSSAYSNDTT